MPDPVPIQGQVASHFSNVQLFIELWPGAVSHADPSCRPVVPPLNCTGSERSRESNVLKQQQQQQQQQQQRPTDWFRRIRHSAEIDIS
jgi:hypothetical protein